MSNKRFGTFDGVFTPTVLSILGVIMFLRLGWVVGQVGLGGAILIILLSNLITLFTGLSVASIVTNLRIGTGGAYAIISKSLGIETGGAVGIPLYLSQAISVAFYITGFTECWTSIFPLHNFILVALSTWLILWGVTYVSAKLAFRLQYIVLGVIAVSLLSAILGKDSFSQPLQLWNGIGNVGFWGVFAIFFPAVTGILAGISMSGELVKPEKNIPFGTLSAIAITLVIYIALAIWFAGAAPASNLANTTSIIIDLARWRPLIITGIMGATISSALSMFVTSPRTLLALGKHRLVPCHTQFSQVSSRGEPSSAILLTALISLITLCFGNLNSIAGILTMFFLITYGMLNFTVFLEKIMGIASFRPAFKIPTWISLIGGIGCFYTMFLINQIFSLIAIAITITIYFVLIKREIQHSLPDVRKGLFIFLSEEALKIASRLPYHPKIWKPNLLIPVSDPQEWMGSIDFLHAIAFPRGRIDFFNLINTAQSADLLDIKAKRKSNFSFLTSQLMDEGLMATSRLIEADDLSSGADVALQAIHGDELSPNVLLVKLSLTDSKDAMLDALINRAKDLGLGILVLRLHPTVGFGQKSGINLWIRQGSPNVHLAILIALQLEKNWDTQLNIIQVVGDNDQRMQAYDYLMKLKRMMRLPHETDLKVVVNNFETALAEAPQASINIFGMASESEFDKIRKISETLCTSTLFLKDSKHEEAFV